MPFREVSKLQQRQQLVYRIRQGWRVSAAAREAGVSRVTAYKWLRRAEQEGLEQLAERSRKPGRSPRATAQELVRSVLGCKAKYPSFGAKKIVARLWPPRQATAPVSVRTVDRLLQRAGLTQPGAPSSVPCQRFAREASNQLWQMDFKGLGKPKLGYWPLSVLDDHARFCLRFEPVATQTQAAVFAVLWQLFGEFGLPEAILTDNGSCFAGTWGQSPSQLEIKLWLLGIRTTQGRPYHPQTQGKVERFHRTIAAELVALGEPLRQPDIDCARQVYPRAVHRYNWERPHEALALQVPGAVYQPSPRPRPAHLPAPQLPLGCPLRKVQPNGEVHYRGRVTRVSTALAGHTLAVQEDQEGFALRFANVEVGRLKL